MGVSYKLSGWEWEGGLVGSPERPLSEMGWRSYVRFWEERVARHLLLGSHDGNSEDEQQQQQQKQEEATATPTTTTTPSNGSKKRSHSENMTVRNMGLATGMLTEDVIIALKSMGVVEPDNSRKKRKTPHQSPAEEHTATGQSGQTVTIHKSNVLEWAKIHRVALRNPVREEGFLGKWARRETLEKKDTESQDAT